MGGYKLLLERCLNVEVLMVLLVFLSSFAFYSTMFMKSPLITGIDGPYYLIQVRGLLEGGTLPYGDPPFAFYLFAFFALILGDVTAGVKLGVSLFCSLSVVPMYLLVKRASGESYGGYLATVLLAFSASFVRMLSDFMKNAVGVFFLISFFYLMHRLAFDGWSLRRFSLAVASLILTGLTHILDLGVALLYLAVYSIVILALNVNRREYAKASGLMGLSVAMFITATALYSPFLFSDYNKILSFFEDLSSVGGEQPTIPVFIPHPRGPRLPMSWLMLALILLAGFLTSIYEWRRRLKESFAQSIVMTIIGALLGFPLIPMMWLWRFMLMEFIPSAVILSHGLTEFRRLLKGESLPAAVTAVGCLSIFIIQSVNVAASVRPTISYPAYLDLVDMRGEIPQNSVVIAPMWIKYWVEFVDGVDVARKPTVDLWSSYSHVLVLFDKDRPPPFVRGLRVLFIGRRLALAELQERRPPG